MQVGDVFNIIYCNSKYKCQIVKIEPSEYYTRLVCTVDLFDKYGIGYRTMFKEEHLLKYKKKAGSSWSCEPLYPKRRSV